jgi:ribonuclease Z
VSALELAISITFLGTGGSVPNKFRNLPSVLLRRGPELFLFDCGEGTQKEFLQARAGINRKMHIFVSHLHGDHLFGLPGMLHSLSFMGRTQELEILGPKGIIQFVKSVNRVVKLYPRFPISIKEVSAGRIVNEPEYEVHAAWGVHSLPCLAYAFQEKPKGGKFDPAKARELGIPEGPLWKKLQVSPSINLKGRRIYSRLVVGAPRRGVKITYAVDTRPCESVVKLAKGSDLLIHDSCFDESVASKAKSYGHSTAVEAARVARKSRARRLALFHISAMYDDPNPLLKQARRVFRQTILCKDRETIYLST